MYLADFGLTKRLGDEESPAGDGPADGHDRLRRPRADPRRAGRRPRRHLLAGLPALRVPDRASTLQAWQRRRNPLCPPRRRAAHNRRRRRPGDRKGPRQDPRRPLPNRRRTHRGGHAMRSGSPRHARPAGSPRSPSSPSRFPSRHSLPSSSSEAAAGVRPPTASCIASTRNATPSPAPSQSDRCPRVSRALRGACGSHRSATARVSLVDDHSLHAVPIPTPGAPVGVAAQDGTAYVADSGSPGVVTVVSADGSRATHTLPADGIAAITTGRGRALDRARRRCGYV